VEECGPCPVFASFYPGICLTTEEKSTEKPQVRVRKTSVSVQHTFTKTPTHYKTLTNTHITNPPTHTHTHTRVHLHIHTHARAHAHTHIYTHTHTYTHTHAHARTHAHAHMHIQIHTHTHTHTLQNNIKPQQYKLKQNAHRKSNTMGRKNSTQFLMLIHRYSTPFLIRPSLHCRNCIVVLLISNLTDFNEI
jgi:hypothetical protein